MIMVDDSIRTGAAAATPAGSIQHATNQMEVHETARWK